jgi:hypothetical protein
MTRDSNSDQTNFKPTAGVAINNAILDPLQGFDADIWILDQATGKNILVGRFTSFQLTVRNSTEPYLEFNQRIPRYLDGELQIGWVCERGLLDVRVIEQTFGFETLSRELRLNRQPRFNITVQLNAQELDSNSFTQNSGYSAPQNGTIQNGELVIGNPTQFGVDNRNNYARRKAAGELNLQYCKLDSFTMGMMAGRSVIANRWEGLAEGIQFIDRTNVWAGTQAQGSATPNSLAQTNLRARLTGADIVGASTTNSTATGNRPDFSGTTNPNSFLGNIINQNVG